jgi:hypothetical protein
MRSIGEKNERTKISCYCPFKFVEINGGASNTKTAMHAAPLRFQPHVPFLDCFKLVRQSRLNVADLFLSRLTVKKRT